MLTTDPYDGRVTYQSDWAEKAQEVQAEARRYYRRAQNLPRWRWIARRYALSRAATLSRLSLALYRVHDGFRKGAEADA